MFPAEHCDIKFWVAVVSTCYNHTVYEKKQIKNFQTNPNLNIFNGNVLIIASISMEKNLLEQNHPRMS